MFCQGFTFLHYRPPCNQEERSTVEQKPPRTAAFIAVVEYAQSGFLRKASSHWEQRKWRIALVGCTHIESCAPAAVPFFLITKSMSWDEIPSPVRLGWFRFAFEQISVKQPSSHKCRIFLVCAVRKREQLLMNQSSVRDALQQLYRCNASRRKGTKVSLVLLQPLPSLQI